MNNPTPIHISLDLETLSTSSNAAIVQIGAVTLDGQEFCEYINPKSSEAAGLDVSVETIQWWSTQDPAIRAQVMGGTTSLATALGKFLKWCQEVGPLDQIHLWSYGGDFDLPILRNAYECFTEYPFNYRNHHCLRTLSWALGLPYIKPARAHNALEDARTQAQLLTMCIKQLTR